ncbi:MAG: hypothetical protein NVS2B9_08170 [Myxococcales bacterium]
MADWTRSGQIGCRRRPAGAAAGPLSSADAIAAQLALLPHGRVHWVTGDHDLHAQHPGTIAGLLAELGAAAPANPVPRTSA